jgi:hypothetical protein
MYNSYEILYSVSFELRYEGFIMHKPMYLNLPQTHTSVISIILKIDPPWLM